MSIDLSKLPEPKVVEMLSYENVLADNLALFKEYVPDYEELESDEYLPVLQTFSYREVLLRTSFNARAVSIMLAYARGADLDNLAAFYFVERLLIDAGDPNANPPVEPTYESDERLLERILLSPGQFSTAGSEDSYKYHAMTANANIKAIGIQTTDIGGEVLLTILSDIDNGLASQQMIDDVNTALSSKKVRPLNDVPLIQSAEIISYEIDATLYFYDGAGVELARQEALNKLTSLVFKLHNLGYGVYSTAIAGALHVEGVEHVELNNFNDIIVGATQAAYCTAITLNNGV